MGIAMKELGLEVWEGMKLYWAQTQHVETLTLERHEPKTYAVNFNVCCWVDEDGKTYVGPFAPKLKTLLKKEGYKKEDFYVPFSHWDFPCELNRKWDELWARTEW